MPLEDYVTLKEAAALIPNVKAGGVPGISRERVWQLIQSGRLPAVKWANRWLIHRDDLAAFLETERREGRPRNE